MFPIQAKPAFPLYTFPSAQNFKPEFPFYRNLWEAGLNPNGGEFSKLKIVHKAVWNIPLFLSGKITVHFDNFPQKMASEANEFSYRGSHSWNKIIESKKNKSAIETEIFWIAKKSILSLFCMQIA